MFSLFMASVFVGCTSEYEEEENQKEDMIIRIQELAEDYGLDIQINQKYFIKHCNELSMDSIKNQFKELATLKGTYDLSLNHRNNLKTTRKIKLLRNPFASSAESYTFSEKDYTNGPDHFTLQCSVYWTETQTQIQNIEVCPYVEKDGGLLEGFRDGHAHADGKTINFEGRYTITERKYYNVCFHYSGSCTSSSGKITWS